MTDSGTKSPRKAIGRGAYFWWCILGYVISFADLWTMNWLEYAGFPTGGPHGLNSTETDLVIFSIMAAIVGVVIIRVVTGILRLRDIGWTSWLVLITLLPFVNFIFDIVLMFRVNKRVELFEYYKRG